MPREHEHCFHTLRGPVHMVVPDGHVVQQCCGCTARQTTHVEHTPEHWGAELSKLGASKGGQARAKSLSPERRSEISRNAARARWGDNR